MKRSEALDVIKSTLDKLKEERMNHPVDDDYIAQAIMEAIESIGMKPPCLPEEDCQAIMRVYIGGNFYQWEEDAIKDEKIQESKRRWEEARADKRPLRVRLAERRAKAQEEHNKRLDVLKAEAELIKKLNDTTEMKERIQSSPNIDLSEFDKDE